ncbi:MAG: adventurous gliding motility lipoprotein CglD [Cystobacterineae bacterium]|nr:adventurous gliding motility lipoprotein CglD [Cystobacterineae bacterium]
MKILSIWSMLLLFPLGCSGGRIDSGYWDWPEAPEEVVEIEPPTKPKEHYGSFEEVPLPPLRELNPDDPHHDLDCDGIPDREEIEKVYPNGRKTDPFKRDTDGDGIWDGVETGRSFSPDPLCENYFPTHLLSATGRTMTDPTRIDTDCDGLSDGDEDKNKNGRMDREETNPTNPDSDNDGLWDGLEWGVMQGLLLREKRHDKHPDPLCSEVTRYATECPTQSQRRITNPLNPDTDGDGIEDGAEDTNKNGCFEMELQETDNLNPEDPSDEETLNACRTDNLVQIDIQRHFAAQIALGLPMGFADSHVDIRREHAGIYTRGLMGLDASRHVAFVAWRHAAWQDMGDVHSLAALRLLAMAQSVYLGGNAVMSDFASWDAPSTEANALSLTFTVSGPGNMSPAARANDIARLLLGEGNGEDTLPTHNSPTGSTQYIRAQYVLRSNGEVIVVVAVALDNNAFSGSSGFFGVADVAGGAALARYFDRTVVHCERSMAMRQPVDILFVVDDSASMGTSQNRLSSAATAMAKALNNSTLDWRVALVTSSYHTSGERNTGIVRGFTNNAQQFQAWLTQDSTCNAGKCTGKWNSAMPAPTCGGNTTLHGNNGGCWIGISGHGYEGTLGAARLALMDMSAPGAKEHIRLREDANIVVIALSDAEDQTTSLYGANASASTWEGIQHFVDFFQGKDTVVPNGKTTVSVPAIRPGKTIRVNAVYCPAGKTCGDDTVPKSPEETRIQRVVNATGGVASSILVDTAISTSMAEIVDRAIGDGGVKTQKPLLGASLRVAIQHPLNSETCDKTNVPRSRQHGFDYDGRSQSVSLFGDCRPAANQDSRMAISYRTWETTHENRLPCENDFSFDFQELDYCKGRQVCDIDKDVCTCPTEPTPCGGCPAGMRCDTKTCTCFTPLG